MRCPVLPRPFPVLTFSTRRPSRRTRSKSLLWSRPLSSYARPTQCPVLTWHICCYQAGGVPHSDPVQTAPAGLMPCSKMAYAPTHCAVLT
eukprot:266622-Rhodomonas_salina.2